ncbi:hypothetical protein [Streptomyces sp. NPDC086989]|uniref:hypothetical protein n=1 Tax=Streptomyces sp. NPDC086989 TaxID=3365764 RepID=UPI0038223385
MGHGLVKGHPQLATSSAQSYETAVQRRLWAVSEDLTGVMFPVAQSQQNPIPSGPAITG